MRYAVTGGSGYIGGRLIDRLVERDDTERVVIYDVRPPRTPRPNVEYRELDVTDRAGVRAALAADPPDALVHLAFILNPMHDENRMYDIDVGGTQNVLDAASSAGVQQVLVTSSAVAYGAFPDNPMPIEEDQPVRGVPDFSYARDKTEADRLCQLWALQHPDRTMTIVRPCIVYGPNVDNYLVRLWTDVPFQVDFGRPTPPVQYVHEDDVVEALVLLLDGRHGGAFNIAGDGTMTFEECATLIDQRIVRFPLSVFRVVAKLMWLLRQAETPPGNLHFVLHPWVLSTQRLKETTGWKPRHTSRETFEITMRAKGRIGGAAEPSKLPEPSVPVGA